MSPFASASSTSTGFGTRYKNHRFWASHRFEAWAGNSGQRSFGRNRRFRKARRTLFHKSHTQARARLEHQLICIRRWSVASWGGRRLEARACLRSPTQTQPRQIHPLWNLVGALTNCFCKSRRRLTSYLRRPRKHNLIHRIIGRTVVLHLALRHRHATKGCRPRSRCLKPGGVVVPGCKRSVATPFVISRLWHRTHSWYCHFHPIPPPPTCSRPPLSQTLSSSCSH